jgi:lipoyl(octanoyl) transferase
MLHSIIQPRQDPARSEVEWMVDHEPVAYEEAVRAMDARVQAIFERRERECVWLLEHPPLYTAGTSADPAELLDPLRFPVVKSGRGGRFTYHGPGQRIAYVMLDLSARGNDVRAFVHALEDWLIAALARLGVAAERHPGEIGVFVGGAKIASIGVRVRRWITLHGASLNVDPDLEHFSGIMPCGTTAPVTSLAALGAEADMDGVDQALRECFERTFAIGALSATDPSPRP